MRVIWGTILRPAVTGIITLCVCGGLLLQSAAASPPPGEYKFILTAQDSISTIDGKQVAKCAPGAAGFPVLFKNNIVVKWASDTVIVNGDPWDIIDASGENVTIGKSFPDEHKRVTIWFYSRKDGHFGGATVVYLSSLSGLCVNGRIIDGLLTKR